MLNVGVEFYYQLTSDQHVKSKCIKQSHKANAKLNKRVARVVQYVGLTKKEIKNEFLFHCATSLLPANMDNPYPF